MSSFDDVHYCIYDETVSGSEKVQNMLTYYMDGPIQRQQHQTKRAVL